MLKVTTPLGARTNNGDSPCCVEFESKNLMLLIKCDFLVPLVP